MGALALLQAGLRVAAACVSRPDFPGMRRLRRRCAEAQAPVFGRPDLADPAVVKLLGSTRPRLIVSYFWHRRVPRAVLDLAPAIGVHPSLLPRHRGADPIFWAIRRGDPETGVTVHRLEEAYDTGAILASRRLAIAPAWNAWQLARALDRPALGAMVETASRLARGEAFAGTPQDEAAATEAPEPTDDDLEIRWSWPSQEVLRLVRAAAPAPGAFSEHRGRTLTVLAASATETTLEPGVAAVVAGGVIVGTRDTAVRLDRVQVDDGPVLDGEAVRGAVPDASDLRGRS